MNNFSRDAKKQVLDPSSNSNLSSFMFDTPVQVE